MKTTVKFGHHISEITLGTVQLGLPYGVNNTVGMPTYQDSATILQAALDAGITSFDTARAYGKSEEVLGRFFSQSSANKTLITKVLFQNEEKNEVSTALFAQVKDSIRKLGVEKLPFLMLHREEYIDRYGKELTDALVELKKDNLVSGIGISFSDKSNLDRMLDTDIFDCIQIPQNIFDNCELTNGTIKRLSDRGIAVFIRSVYLQGLFFKDTNCLTKKLVAAKPALDKLHALADAHGLSMSQLALSYIRDGSGITSLVLGCETVEQLNDSIEQFGCPKMSDGLRESLNEISQEVDPIVMRPWEWNS